MIMPDSNERQVATTYGGIRADHVARYEWAVKEIAARYPDPKTATACDYGCGVGYGTYLIRDVVRAVFGFDRDEATLCFARDHWKREDVAFIHYDLEQAAPFVASDVAVAFEIIEHLKDPVPWLSTVRSQVLIGSVPNEDAFPWDAGLMYHYRHYTQLQLADLLEATGWRVVTMALQSDDASEVRPYKTDDYATARTLCFVAERVPGYEIGDTSDDAPYAHPTGNAPKTVMLCGLGPSKYELTEFMLKHDYTSPCEETWTVNKGVAYLPKADVVFVMDDIADYADKHPAYGRELAAYEGCVIGQTAFPDEAEALGISHFDYPLEAVLDFWGGNCANWLHTISLGYVLAYAGYIGVEKLFLAGVDCSWPGRPDLSEAGNAVVCYWIGRLEQSGCEVVINGESTLNSTKYRHNYDWRRFYGYLRQPKL